MKLDKEKLAQLVKTAKEVKVRDELDWDNSDFTRAQGRGLAYLVPSSYVGSRIGGLFGNKYNFARKQKGAAIGGIVGGLIGGTSGINASYRNQLRELQTHDIKLQDANNRLENHRARMLQKHAQLVTDQVKKDVVGTGTIAALGGLGTLAAHKVLAPGSSNKKVFAVGTGIGLVADYAGLKIGQGYNSYVDSKKKNG